MRVLQLDLVSRLKGIHSALDDALGDSDIEHLTLEEIRDAHPIQWAAMMLAQLIGELEMPEGPAGDRGQVGWMGGEWDR